MRAGPDRLTAIMEVGSDRLRARGVPAAILTSRSRPARLALTVRTLRPDSRRAAPLDAQAIQRHRCRDYTPGPSLPAPPNAAS